MKRRLLKDVLLEYGATPKDGMLTLLNVHGNMRSVAELTGFSFWTVLRFCEQNHIGSVQTYVDMKNVV